MNKRTYTLQPAPHGGFWMYDQGLRLMGWTPDVSKAKHMIPREQVKIGTAKPVSHREPFEKPWHGWEWDGELFPRSWSPGGTSHGKTMVDMVTGEVFREGKRNARLKLAKGQGR
jgi:hypothetical protein